MPVCLVCCEDWRSLLLIFCWLALGGAAGLTVLQCRVAVFQCGWGTLVVVGLARWLVGVGCGVVTDTYVLTVHGFANMHGSDGCRCGCVVCGVYGMCVCICCCCCCWSVFSGVVCFDCVF